MYISIGSFHSNHSGSVRNQGTYQNQQKKNPPKPKPLFKKYHPLLMTRPWLNSLHQYYLKNNIPNDTTALSQQVNITSWHFGTDVNGERFYSQRSDTPIIFWSPSQLSLPWPANPGKEQANRNLGNLSLSNISGIGKFSLSGQHLKRGESQLHFGSCPLFRCGVLTKSLTHSENVSSIRQAMENMQGRRMPS